MTKQSSPSPVKVDEHTKDKQLEAFRNDPKGTQLTTDQGVGIPNTDDSLKAGTRGPTLLEDFHLREKITRFDHERIPERAVHARGSGAHGVFQPYPEAAKYSRAKFLADPSVKTPVFVRFSTVGGSRGSADTARDIRGFAVKFYTPEGNYDLVGNNVPVFFVQDAIKFPDLVHAVKPEPHNEIPQASSAHDNFWDFVSLVPETTHTIMWVLSDRAIPRSLRMMEGFGVHTFRLIDAAGKARFVKFHWKPVLGVHSLVWDEAQKIAGKDPDFHRRDLWDAIESGAFPEWELGVQVIEESDEHAFDFDLLDASKLVPEELVPVERIGKLTLNRNPDNFFAETEQVAFCPANLVPGIDFTDDPLLQGRLFSYLDTQLSRLGSPNFAQIPINQPVAPVHNHQQDGHMQTKVLRSRANYHPNSTGGGCPFLASPDQGGFSHYPERLAGHVVRERSPSFKDHFTQARLFWNSLSEPEKKHLVLAARFELGKVESKEIRQRVVNLFASVDVGFAQQVAAAIGVTAEAPAAPPPKAQGKRAVDRSPALSMANTVKGSIATRRVAVLIGEGVRGDELKALVKAIESGGGKAILVGPVVGAVKADDGSEVMTKDSLLTTASVLFDAVFVPGGKASVAALAEDGAAVHFINEAFRHYKAIGATSEGVDLLAASSIKGVKVSDAQGAPVSDRGVVTARGGGHGAAVLRAFVEAVGQHRHWDRDQAMAVPA